MKNSKISDRLKDKYPKRVFEVILEKTHHKEESDYFFYTALHKRKKILGVKLNILLKVTHLAQLAQ